MKYFFAILFFLIAFSFPAIAREPYQVYLAAKSKLISISDPKDIITTDRAMYVYVLEENPNTKKQFWVYNNKKEKKYLTSAFNITEIDPELRLLPSVDGNKIYRTKRTLQPEDQIMPFESNFALHFEQVSMTEFNSIYKEQTNRANATRFEIRSLYQTQLPGQFGLNINFQNIYWANGAEQVRLSLLSLGPGFSYKFIDNEHFALSFLTSAEFAPIAQSSSSLNTDKFSAYSFDAGIEGEISSRFGIFTLGSHFRQYHLLLKSSTRTDFEMNTGEYNLSSLGVSIGYKVGWNL